MKLVTKIKNLFRKKYTITIHFKSGAITKRKAYTFDITKSGNDITELKYEWVSGRTLYIHLDSIEMIAVN